jgi:MFS family permease
MRLTTIIILLLAGILAGTQLGKIAPLVGWYQQEIGFSLVLTGWFTALIGMFVALAALPAGWAIEAFGVRRSFIVSSAVLAVGGVALSFFTTPAAILAARLVEGLGYLALVIAIPALLNSIPAARWRPAALAVWGGFVPLGYAIGDFLARAVNAPANPRHFLLVAILLFAAMAMPAALLLWRVGDSDGPITPTRSDSSRFWATLNLPVILVSLSFGIYVILSIGFFAFLPTFLQGEGSTVWLSAGAISLTVPLGNLLAGLLVRNNARAILMLAVLGFAASALVAYPAFAVVEGVSAAAALVVFAIAGGLTASALFAAIPAIVPHEGSPAIAIGLVCQAGGIGTVLGPPLAASVIESHGWTGVSWFIVVVALAGIASLLPLFVGRAMAMERAVLDRR